jgi:hypothetical protein
VADTKAKVANINSGTSYDVHIGRQRSPKMWGGGYHLPRSAWANPFKVGEDGTIEEVIEKYERYLFDERPYLVARLLELRGKTLACWCKPEPCHGDVLARLAEALGVDLAELVE